MDVNCKNCIAVIRILGKLVESKNFSIFGSKDTITCKAGHKVYD